MRRTVCAGGFNTDLRASNLTERLVLGHDANQTPPIRKPYLEFTGEGAYLTPILEASETMATKTNPFQFVQQTRAEIAKIVWPTRREVLLTTVMVFVLSAITALFFSLVDIAIKSGLQATLNVFGS